MHFALHLKRRQTIDLMRHTMAEPTKAQLHLELPETTITDLLQRWPETAVVFHRHKMACVGCAVAPFYTVADAAQIYGLSPEEFVAELVAMVAAPG